MLAAELVLTECFRSFCRRPGSELVERDGVVGAMTDIPISFFNGVGTTRLDDPDAVRRVVNAFKKHGRSFRWWVSSSSLAESLQAHGLTHRWNSPAMVMDLGVRRQSRRSPTALVIQHYEWADPARVAPHGSGSSK